MPLSVKKKSFVVSTYLETGIMASSHSYCPCTPLNPLMIIHSLVSRRTKLSTSNVKNQNKSVLEALKTYTINAAFHSFDEDKLGSIEFGKLADFVVLSDELLMSSAERIKDIEVEMTFVNGELVYTKIDKYRKYVRTIKSG